MPVFLDYEVLRVIWWLLLFVLFIGFAVLDGYDMGVGALLPFIAKNDTEKRILINSIGPTWESHQVWFVLGGGTLFAAWPLVYAVAFSGFYLAMFVLLFVLILRPVGFKFRSKIENTSWKNTWDNCLFISGTVAPVLLGIALGNALIGVPFDINDELRASYTGNGLFELIRPFPLLCGLVSLSMILMQGAIYLVNKTEDNIATRARLVAFASLWIFVLLFAAGGYFVTFLDGYVLQVSAGGHAPSNPLNKVVSTRTGALLDNYAKYPLFIIAPVMGFLGALGAFITLLGKRDKIAMLCSSLAIAGVILTAAVSSFPFILPSSVNPSVSLTVWDASGSHLTLFIMLIATIIFLPLILFYVSWALRVMQGKVTAAYIRENKEDLY